MISINNEKVEVKGSKEEIATDIFRLFRALKGADVPNLKLIVKVIESICGFSKEEESQEEEKQEEQEKTLTLSEMRILMGVAGAEIAEERELDDESAEGLMDIAANLMVTVEAYVDGTKQIDEEKYAIYKEYDAAYQDALKK